MPYLSDLYVYYCRLCGLKPNSRLVSELTQFNANNLFNCRKEAITIKLSDNFLFPPKIVEIDISNNYIGSKGLFPLLLFAKNALLSLEVLRLQYNKIMDRDVKTISTILKGENKTYAYLKDYLGANFLIEHDVTDEILNQNNDRTLAFSKLHTLDLRNNDITNAALPDITSLIRFHTGIINVLIEGNRIDVGTVESVLLSYLIVNRCLSKCEGNCGDYNAEIKIDREKDSGKTLFKKLPRIENDAILRELLTTEGSKMATNELHEKTKLLQINEAMNIDNKTASVLDVLLADFVCSDNSGIVGQSGGYFLNHTWRRNPQFFLYLETDRRLDNYETVDVQIDFDIIETLENDNVSGSFVNNKSTCEKKNDQSSRILRKKIDLEYYNKKKGRTTRRYGIIVMRGNGILRIIDVSPNSFSKDEQNPVLGLGVVIAESSFHHAHCSVTIQDLQPNLFSYSTSNEEESNSKTLLKERMPYENPYVIMVTSFEPNKSCIFRLKATIIDTDATKQARKVEQAYLLDHDNDHLSTKLSSISDSMDHYHLLLKKLNRENDWYNYEVYGSWEYLSTEGVDTIGGSLCCPMWRCNTGYRLGVDPYYVVPLKNSVFSSDERERIAFQTHRHCSNYHVSLKLSSDEKNKPSYTKLFNVDAGVILRNNKYVDDKKGCSQVTEIIMADHVQDPISVIANRGNRLRYDLEEKAKLKEGNSVTYEKTIIAAGIPLKTLTRLNENELVVANEETKLSAKKKKNVRASADKSSFILSGTVTLVVVLTKDFKRMAECFDYVTSFSKNTSLKEDFRQLSKAYELEQDIVLNAITTDGNNRFPMRVINKTQERSSGQNTLSLNSHLFSCCTTSVKDSKGDNKSITYRAELPVSALNIYLLPTLSHRVSSNTFGLPFLFFPYVLQIFSTAPIRIEPIIHPLKASYLSVTYLRNVLTGDDCDRNKGVYRCVYEIVYRAIEDKINGLLDGNSLTEASDLDSVSLVKKNEMKENFDLEQRFPFIHRAFSSFTELLSTCEVDTHKKAQISFIREGLLHFQEQWHYFSFNTVIDQSLSGGYVGHNNHLCKKRDDDVTRKNNSGRASAVGAGGEIFSRESVVPGNKTWTHSASLEFEITEVKQQQYHQKSNDNRSSKLVNSSLSSSAIDLCIVLAPYVITPKHHNENGALIVNKNQKTLTKCIENNELSSQLIQFGNVGDVEMCVMVCIQKRRSNGAQNNSRRIITDGLVIANSVTECPLLANANVSVSHNTNAAALIMGSKNLNNNNNDRAFSRTLEKNDGDELNRNKFLHRIEVLAVSEFTSYNKLRNVNIGINNNNDVNCNRNDKDDTLVDVKIQNFTTNTTDIGSLYLENLAVGTYFVVIMTRTAGFVTDRVGRQLGCNIHFYASNSAYHYYRDTQHQNNTKVSSFSEEFSVNKKSLQRNPRNIEFKRCDVCRVTTPMDEMQKGISAHQDCFIIPFADRLRNQLSRDYFEETLAMYEKKTKEYSPLTGGHPLLRITDNDNIYQQHFSNIHIGSLNEISYFNDPHRTLPGISELAITSICDRGKSAPLFLMFVDKTFPPTISSLLLDAYECPGGNISIASAISNNFSAIGTYHHNHPQSRSIVTSLQPYINVDQEGLLTALRFLDFNNVDITNCFEELLSTCVATEKADLFVTNNTVPLHSMRSTQILKEGNVGAYCTQTLINMSDFPSSSSCAVINECGIKFPPVFLAAGEFGGDLSMNIFGWTRASTIAKTQIMHVMRLIKDAEKRHVMTIDKSEGNTAADEFTKKRAGGWCLMSEDSILNGFVLPDGTPVRVLSRRERTALLLLLLHKQYPLLPTVSWSGDGTIAEPLSKDSMLTGNFDETDQNDNCKTAFVALINDILDLVGNKSQGSTTTSGQTHPLPFNATVATITDKSNAGVVGGLHLTHGLNHYRHLFATDAPFYMGATCANISYYLQMLPSVLSALAVITSNINFYRRIVVNYNNGTKNLVKATQDIGEEASQVQGFHNYNGEGQQCISKDGGSVCFRFYINNKWQDVIIDDYLPVDSTILEYDSVGGKIANKLNNNTNNFSSSATHRSPLCFLSSIAIGDALASLIEKAYAKVHQCYQFLYENQWRCRYKKVIVGYQDAQVFLRSPLQQTNGENDERQQYQGVAVDSSLSTKSNSNKNTVYVSTESISSELYYEPSHSIPSPQGVNNGTLISYRPQPPCIGTGVPYPFPTAAMLPSSRVLGTNLQSNQIINDHTILAVNEATVLTTNFATFRGGESEFRGGNQINNDSGGKTVNGRRMRENVAKELSCRGPLPHAYKFAGEPTLQLLWETITDFTGAVVTIIDITSATTSTLGVTPEEAYFPSERELVRDYNNPEGSLHSTLTVGWDNNEGQGNKLTPIRHSLPTTSNNAIDSNAYYASNVMPPHIDVSAVGGGSVYVNEDLVFAKTIKADTLMHPAICCEDDERQRALTIENQSNSTTINNSNISNSSIEPQQRIIMTAASSAERGRLTVQTHYLPHTPLSPPPMRFVNRRDAVWSKILACAGADGFLCGSTVLSAVLVQGSNGWRQKCRQLHTQRFQLNNSTTGNAEPEELCDGSVQKTISGLLLNAAYPIIAAREVMGKRLIKLYNNYGNMGALIANGANCNEGDKARFYVAPTTMWWKGAYAWCSTAVAATYGHSDRDGNSRGPLSCSVSGDGLQEEEGWTSQLKEAIGYNIHDSITTFWVSLDELLYYFSHLIQATYHEFQDSVEGVYMLPSRGVSAIDTPKCTVANTVLKISKQLLPELEPSMARAVFMDNNESGAVELVGRSADTLLPSQCEEGDAGIIIGGPPTLGSSSWLGNDQYFLVAHPLAKQVDLLLLSDGASREQNSLKNGNINFDVGVSNDRYVNVVLGIHQQNTKVIMNRSANASYTYAAVPIGLALIRMVNRNVDNMDSKQYNLRKVQRLPEHLIPIAALRGKQKRMRSPEIKNNCKNIHISHTECTYDTPSSVRRIPNSNEIVEVIIVPPAAVRDRYITVRVPLGFVEGKTSRYLRENVIVMPFIGNGQDIIASLTGQNNENEEWNGDVGEKRHVPAIRVVKKYVDSLVSSSYADYEQNGFQARLSVPDDALVNKYGSIVNSTKVPYYFSAHCMTNPVSLISIPNDTINCIIRGSWCKGRGIQSSQITCSTKSNDVIIERNNNSLYNNSNDNNKNSTRMKTISCLPDISTAGGGPMFGSWVNNPQYLLYPAYDCDVTIVLKQNHYQSSSCESSHGEKSWNVSACKSTTNYIGFVVVDTLGSLLRVTHLPPATENDVYSNEDKKLCEDYGIPLYTKNSYHASLGRSSVEQKSLFSSWRHSMKVLLDVKHKNDYVVSGTVFLRGISRHDGDNNDSDKESQQEGCKKWKDKKKRPCGAPYHLIPSQLLPLTEGEFTIYILSTSPITVTRVGYTPFLNDADARIILHKSDAENACNQRFYVDKPLKSLDYKRRVILTSFSLKEGTCGGGPQYSTWRNNPQFLLNFPYERSGQMLISITVVPYLLMNDIPITTSTTSSLLSVYGDGNNDDATRRKNNNHNIGGKDGRAWSHHSVFSIYDCGSTIIYNGDDDCDYSENVENKDKQDKPSEALFSALNSNNLHIQRGFDTNPHYSDILHQTLIKNSSIGHHVDSAQETKMSIPNIDSDAFGDEHDALFSTLHHRTMSSEPVGLILFHSDDYGRGRYRKMVLGNELSDPIYVTAMERGTRMLSDSGSELAPQVSFTSRVKKDVDRCCVTHKGSLQKGSPTPPDEEVVPESEETKARHCQPFASEYRYTFHTRKAEYGDDLPPSVEEYRELLAEKEEFLFSDKINEKEEQTNENNGIDQNAEGERDRLIRYAGTDILCDSGTRVAHNEMFYDFRVNRRKYCPVRTFSEIESAVNGDSQVFQLSPLLEGSSVEKGNNVDTQKAKKSNRLPSDEEKACWKKMYFEGVNTNNCISNNSNKTTNEKTDYLSSSSIEQTVSLNQHAVQEIVNTDMIEHYNEPFILMPYTQQPLVTNMTVVITILSTAHVEVEPVREFLNPINEDLWNGLRRQKQCEEGEGNTHERMKENEEGKLDNIVYGKKKVEKSSLLAVEKERYGSDSPRHVLTVKKVERDKEDGKGGDVAASRNHIIASHPSYFNSLFFDKYCKEKANMIEGKKCDHKDNVSSNENDSLASPVLSSVSLLGLAHPDPIDLFLTNNGSRTGCMVILEGEWIPGVNAGGCRYKNNSWVNNPFYKLNLLSSHFSQRATRVMFIMIYYPREAPEVPYCKMIVAPSSIGTNGNEVHRASAGQGLHFPQTNKKSPLTYRCGNNDNTNGDRVDECKNKYYTLKVIVPPRIKARPTLKKNTLTLDSKPSFQALVTWNTDKLRKSPVATMPLPLTRGAIRHSTNLTHSAYASVTSTTGPLRPSHDPLTTFVPPFGFDLVADNEEYTPVFSSRYATSEYEVSLVARELIPDNHGVYCGDEEDCMGTKKKMNKEGGKGREERVRRSATCAPYLIVPHTFYANQGGYYKMIICSSEPIEVKEWKKPRRFW